MSKVDRIQAMLDSSDVESNQLGFELLKNSYPIAYYIIFKFKQENALPTTRNSIKIGDFFYYLKDLKLFEGDQVIVKGYPERKLVIDKIMPRIGGGVITSVDAQCVYFNKSKQSFEYSTFNINILEPI